MPTSSTTAVALEVESTLDEDSTVASSDRREILCLAELFSALGDPSRLTILRVLESDGETAVSDIADAVGLSVSAVSHQLRLLRDRELITARRRGREVRYSISDEHVSMMLELGVDHATEDCSKRRGA